MSKHCQIDFDPQKKIFRFRAQIHSSKPPQIHEYVEARGGQRFRPHSTFFCLDERGGVSVVQEISFTAGDALRRQLLEFWRIAKYCTEVLEEIAAEDSLTALKI